MLSSNQIGQMIPIADYKGQQAVNARNLYQWLEVKRDFSDWIKRQFVRCDLTENQDFEVFYNNVGNSQGGRPATEYALSINAAKEISMMSQTEKGKIARRYFIECERMAKIKSGYLVPQNYEEALEQLLVQVKRNKQLDEENHRLQQDVQTQQNINGLLMADIDTMQPKARIYDQVIHNCDDKDLFTVSAVGNEIGMSGQKLNKMLIACGIIYQAQNGDYLFTSEYLTWNLGRSVSACVNESTGKVRTYIKWNNRGRAYIHALYDTNWDKRRAWHLLKDGKEVQA